MCTYLIVTYMFLFSRDLIFVIFLKVTKLLSNSEYREHLKYFRNVDCVVVTNHNEILEHSSKPQNHKLITVAVCGLVFSRLIGFSLQHNNIPLIFLVFTVF